jgi:hypothetical protein
MTANLNSHVEWPAWSIDQDPATLGRYVVPDVVAQHVPIPASAEGSATGRLRTVWAALHKVRISYANERPGRERGTQDVRAPGEVLFAPRAGTCLDLALVLTGACTHAGLNTAVIIVEPTSGDAALHALVAVGLGPTSPLTALNAEEAWLSPPTGFLASVARSLDGPPREIAVLEPNGLARPAGTAPTPDLDTDLETAVSTGHRNLSGDQWRWRLAVPPAPPDRRFRPAGAPAVEPLRRPYRHTRSADSPLRLLRAEYALTPFQARDELTVLEDFSQKIAAGDHTGLAVVHGAGGSGKTRLGLELAERLRP